MSLFGVFKINQLTDCTHVLPSQNPTFTNSTQNSCASSSSASYSTKPSVSPTSYSTKASVTAYTTSTVYTTKTYTTIKCAEQIFICLWWTPYVGTTSYPVATTVVPVTPTPSGYSSKPASAKPTTTKPPVVWWKE